MISTSKRTSMFPNILFIIDDQHNADCFGFSGKRQVQTPNIDRLVAGGTVFNHAYTPIAVCMASRVCFLTGTYPHTSGIFANDNKTMEETPLSLPTFLRDSCGYQTSLVGKAHLGRWHNVGYDQRITVSDPLGCDQYDEYLKRHGLKKDHANKETIEKRFYCFDTEIPFEHCIENWTGNETIKQIDAMSRQEKPFFLCSSFSGPHAPNAIPLDSPFRYDPADVDLPCECTNGFNTKPFGRRAGIENKWNVDDAGEENLRYALASYYSSISSIDYNIGKIVSHLEEKSMLENTLIIITSDHGDFAGAHGQYAKNCSGGYDPLHRIPFIWYWQGMLEHHICNSLVESIDLFPTICEILGLDIPAPIQGDSLCKALFPEHDNGSNSFPGKDAVFFETAFVKTVRTTKWKLSYGFNGKNAGELYDLVSDPEERINLYNQSKYISVQKQLLEKLLNWYISTDQPKFFNNDFGVTADFRWYRKKFPHQYNSVQGWE